VLAISHSNNGAFGRLLCEIASHSSLTSLSLYFDSVRKGFVPSDEVLMVIIYVYIKRSLEVRNSTPLSSKFRRGETIILVASLLP
jgi:hypothetical protein